MGICYNLYHDEMMKEAIDALQELPEERQELVARAILNYTSHDGEEVYRLSDEEAVRVGVAQAERGEFVSDTDLKAFRNRHRA
jgi:predicted transcriptional regulator